MQPCCRNVVPVSGTAPRREAKTSTKTTYLATTPNGTVEEFTSSMHYTHAVWINRPEGGQGFVKRTANPAAAIKQPGQTSRQSAYFKSLGFGIVELEVIG